MAPPEKCENQQQMIIVPRGQQVTGGKGPLSSETGPAGQTPCSTPSPLQGFTSRHLPGSCFVIPGPGHTAGSAEPQSTLCSLILIQKLYPSSQEPRHCPHKQLLLAFLLGPFISRPSSSLLPELSHVKTTASSQLLQEVPLGLTQLPLNQDSCP